MKISDLCQVERLDEIAAKRKKVVRRGKVIRKKDCPPGYKLVDGIRCMKMSTKDRVKRTRAGKKAAKKSKAARKRTLKRSMRIRARRIRKSR
jgi:hypothetical protein